jgi:2-polyprenyl-3-methyl-5-hydroxy-6-metoxy-1,4-benzoquinol methylase
VASTREAWRARRLLPFGVGSEAGREAHEGEGSVLSDTAGEKTTKEYWNDVWLSPPRLRLPLGLNVGTRNTQRLLRAHVRPGMRVLEIGCAPGKMLAWVAKALKANVAGLDYSERGMLFCQTLFHALAIEADLRCEDLFVTTFPPKSFSVVFSMGVIEHFNDPREAVKSHVMLLRSGGTALIAVPNFGGFYGRLQRMSDPQTLSLHNTSIMNAAALRALAPEDLVDDVRVYPFGRISPWILSFDERWPRLPMRAIQYAINAAACAQPFDISGLCPMFVLEMRRQCETP